MCGSGVCGHGLFGKISTMKNIKVLFVLAVFLWGQVVSQYTDYCALCSNHTRCIYRGLGSKCGYTSVGGSLSESEKQVILDTHNSLRALVALGGETRGYPGPQPAATDMQYLTWDDELARTAQAWADQCDFGHDACRLDPRFSVGQNVFLSEGGVPWEQALLSWYSEVEFMDAANVDNFIFDEVTGHYAQMVWGNTRRIGCGKRTYPQRPKRYYKRDTSHAGESTPQLDEHFQEAQEENIRQARRIGNYQSNSRNQFGQEKGYQNNGKYQQNYYTQQPTTANNQQYYYSEEPQTPKPVQQTSDIHKKQLKFYNNYLDQMKQLDSPYLSYENKYRLYKELEQKHEILSNIHSRVLYHDQRLKDKIARTKKLNPYIQKGYSFQPDHTVVSGKEFEYYVCNYGPTGLYPGARMYTKGYNNCPYGGLCADPLTVSFYSGLDRENDPILSLLNDSK